MECKYLPNSVVLSPRTKLLNDVLIFYDASPTGCISAVLMHRIGCSMSEFWISDRDEFEVSFFYEALFSRKYIVWIFILLRATKWTNCFLIVSLPWRISQKWFYRTSKFYAMACAHYIIISFQYLWPKTYICLVFLRLTACTTSYTLTSNFMW